MKAEDFIVDVKTRYGEQRTRDGRLVRDLDDRELLEKMLERYPGERENIEDLDEYMGDDIYTVPDVPKTDVQEKLDTAKKSLFSRIGSRIGQAGERVYSEITGEGENAGESPLRRGFEATAAAFGAVPAVASEFLPEPVRTGLEKTGEFVGEQIQEKVIEPIADIPQVQEFAQSPAGEVTEELAGIASAGGEIAGSILGAGTVKPTVQAIKTGAQKAAPVIDKATEGIRQARITKTKQDVDDAVGRILQGKPEDIEQGKRALSNIDTDGIKTYEDLNIRINERVGSLSEKLEEHLDTNAPAPLKPNELAIRVKVGDNTVFQTPVQDALRELRDYYTKINDVRSAEEVRQMVEKLNTTGLTLKEVNNIAKLHGRDLNAFNASGELASGLSKQAAENTRKGLKNVVRERLPDDVAKELDKQMSDLLQTSQLTKKMEENVNKLYQKVKKRSLAAKAGGLAADIIDLASFGTLRGFVAKLFPSNVGLKTANSLDLERELKKNLEKIQKLNAIEDPKKFSEAMTAYINEVQPGLSTRVASGLSNTEKDALLKRLNEVTSKDVMKGEQIDLDLMERLEDLKAQSERAGGLTEREYAELNALMDEVGTSFKSGVTPELMEEARKYKSAEEFIDELPTGGKEGREVGKGLGYYKIAGRNLKPIGGDEMVTIWRGMPKGTNNKIIDGDYVSLNRNSAAAYGNDLKSYEVPKSKLYGAEGRDDLIFFDGNTEKELTDIWKQANQ